MAVFLYTTVYTTQLYVLKRHVIFFVTFLETAGLQILLYNRRAVNRPKLLPFLRPWRLPAPGAFFYLFIQACFRWNPEKIQSES